MELKENLQSRYDVAICGGGLAGLTLARQLKLNLTDASVVLIEKTSRPLPQGTLKVGESTVELGAFYLRESLKLAEYLKGAHLSKLGLRFFFGDAHGSFAARPEFGLSAFPEVSSYQIDRGILENDLRRIAAESGVMLLEGHAVQDIEIGEQGADHDLAIKDLENGQTQKLSARWVVDAMGRRRYLQKKLDLTKDIKQPCSAAWFRLEGRVDVSDFVSTDDREWHDRVPGDIRYFSTNHLMGEGYWVWLIPLSSNNTSIGIVALEEIHPFDRINTFERALDWIEEFEPVLHPVVTKHRKLDFRCMRRYSYSSHQVFSQDRWACVGEAGIFPDPFYSPGIDFIGFANTMTVDMIRQDFMGALPAGLVDEYNSFLLAINDLLTRNIHLGYPLFGNSVVMAAKFIWDFAAAWGNLAPQMFNSIFLDEETRRSVRSITGRFFFLSNAVQKLFVDWSSKQPGRLSYEFIDYLSIEFLRDFRLRNLRSGKEPAELVEDFKNNMDRFEELAQVLFLLAVEDVEEEHLAQFPAQNTWLNAWAVDLDPQKWEDNGLFKPLSERRDLSVMRKQVQSLFNKRESKPAPLLSLAQSGS